MHYIFLGELSRRSINPLLLHNLMFITGFTKARHCILPWQFKQFRIVTTNFSEIHFNIILWHVFRSLALRISNHTLYDLLHQASTCSGSLILLDLIILIILREEYTLWKLLIMGRSQIFLLLTLSYVQIFSSALSFPNTFNFYSSLRVTDQVSHPYTRRYETGDAKIYSELNESKSFTNLMCS